MYNSTEEFLTFFVIWVICGWLGYKIAEKRGRTASHWGAACFLLPIVFLPLLFILPRKGDALVEKLAEKELIKFKVEQRLAAAKKDFD